MHTKSFAKVEDTYPYIESFFAANTFDNSNFKLENTWMENSAEHFSSHNDRHIVNKKVAWRYFLKTCALPLITPIFLLCQMIFGHGSNPFFVYVLLPIVFFFFGGMHLILFFNYYIFARKKVLIMPFNSDLFYFGSVDNPRIYYKKDVMQITNYHLVSGKNMISNFELDKIEFNDGSIIYLPNIFDVKYMYLENCPSKHVNRPALIFGADKPQS